MTLGVGVLTFALFTITIPKVVDNTEASRRTDDLNTCRAGYRSDIDIARIALDRAEDARQDVADRMLQAIGRQDATAVATLVAEQVATEAAANDALAAVDAAAVRYQDENRLSQTDPALFLSRCKEN